MRKFRLRGFGLALIAISVFFSFNILAQSSTVDASVSRNRAKAKKSSTSNQSKSQYQRKSNRSSYANPSNSSNSYSSENVMFEAPDEVAVEEFINYHRHSLPLPKVGESVALDMRWGNNEVSYSQREAVLQIGWTTAFANDRTDLRPLNLSLVIDKSGSMAAEDKMSRVKESLLTMIGQLRPDDYISVVVFDHEAKVICPSMRVGDGYRLKNAIKLIKAEGSTNLHGGLMLGYQEAQRFYQKDATNRVILLTDGIANVGTTDPKTIAIESSEYNGQGIDLSTIGVGGDLDMELLRTLSKQGRGLFHFVADAHDINKVFVDEVQSLMSPVARNVSLDIDFDANLELEKLFGYEPRFRQNGLTIPIADMNNSLTQLIMLKFRLKNPASSKRDFPIRIKLSYFDIKTKRQIADYQIANLRINQDAPDELLLDSMVRKNYTIAELAQSLFEMSEVAKKKDYRTAENLLNNSVATTYRRYPNMEDKDIRFILDIVEDYQRNLRKFNRRDRNNDCRQCE